MAPDVMGLGVGRTRLSQPQKGAGIAKGAKLGDAMPNDKEVFSHQVFLLILGVFLGAVPTLFITTVQLRYQSQQALREKQIAVLHDLAVSLNGGGRVVAKFSALHDSLLMLPDVPTRQEWNDFIRRKEEVNTEYENWIADMRTQNIVMESVFGASLPIPEFSGVPEIEPISSPASGAAKKKAIESTQQDIHSLTMSLIALMNGEQKVLNDIAKRIS